MDYQKAPEEAVAPGSGPIVGAWLFVGIPFAYGVYELIKNVSLLFTG